ncbi:MAG TPA: (2Fe-2S) ferredoxin domain-containing protein [Armatimonadota bacterium]
MGNVHKSLVEIKKKASSLRHKRLASVTTRVIVGTATCGVSAGAKGVVDALKQEVKARGIKGALVSETGCSGRCDLEPLVQVIRDGEAPALYFHVTPEMARRIVQQHVQSGDVIEEWTLT